MNFIAGDIGGTKILLGIFTWENKIIKLYQKKYLSSDWNAFRPILLDFITSLPNGIQPPTYGCFALAGPVSNGSCELTNLGWKLNQDEIQKSINLSSLELINDVGVLIYGIPFLNSRQFVQVQVGKEKSQRKRTIAVLAAGTGLGIAKGIITKKKILAFPSEGGHSEFSPRTKTEWELSEWLKADLKLERLSIERVVSGNGLGHIARWRLKQTDAISHPLKNISEAWRLNKELDLPSLASKAAKNGDKMMKEVLSLWLSAYGSVAGDLALQELCESGLWIGGGATTKQLDGIRSTTFLESLKRKGRFYKYLEEIPVMAIIDPEAGLFSAACRARMLAE
ncbi:glucokinase [Prochlorococcus sp. MIT 1307]|uniref:glucokinase n=1 Tax=Prochlorococcus sp. MIT 1307 TaxID=3096219 RepID=UPI002A748C4D|nr:glucokinase [Prochlorococcus sp. MIT 1307]